MMSSTQPIEGASTAIDAVLAAAPTSGLQPLLDGLVVAPTVAARVVLLEQIRDVATSFAPEPGTSVPLARTTLLYLREALDLEHVLAPAAKSEVLAKRARVMAARCYREAAAIATEIP